LGWNLNDKSRKADKLKDFARRFGQIIHLRSCQNIIITFDAVIRRVPDVEADGQTHSDGDLQLSREDLFLMAVVNAILARVVKPDLAQGHDLKIVFFLTKKKLFVICFYSYFHKNHHYTLFR
jgi:hypothetical protein